MNYIILPPKISRSTILRRSKVYIVKGEVRVLEGALLRAEDGVKILLINGKFKKSLLNSSALIFNQGSSFKFVNLTISAADENYKIVKQLLSSKNKPDAIFASVEKLAITAYEVCNDLNIKIPNDIKIICFSNLATAALLNPSLSTITQPAYEIGKKAAEVLFKYLDKNKKYITKEF